MENTLMKEIYEELKGNEDIYNTIKAKTLIQKLPFLIRTNGLINVLEYLDKNDQEKHCKKLKKFFLSTLGYDEEKTYDLETDEYMFVSKQVYDLSVKLRSMYGEISCKKAVNKNQDIKNDDSGSSINYKRNKDCENINFNLKFNRYLSIINNKRIKAKNYISIT